VAVDRGVRSLAVTSCIQGEGKSITVANLAITMALAGKKVVVVDADLRRPRQHKLLAHADQHGLSTVASGRSTLTESLVPIELQPQTGDGSRDDFAVWASGAHSRSRIYVLPSGPIPPNPGEIVTSRRFATIIAELEKEADLVLVDTPAMLAVGESRRSPPR
jgi:Mrp family chromosome partitioning ATPase